MLLHISNDVHVDVPVVEDVRNSFENLALAEGVNQSQLSVSYNTLRQCDFGLFEKLEKLGNRPRVISLSLGIQEDCGDLESLLE